MTRCPECAGEIRGCPAKGICREHRALLAELERIGDPSVEPAVKVFFLGNWWDAESFKLAQARVALRRGAR